MDSTPSAARVRNLMFSWIPFQWLFVGSFGYEVFRGRILDTPAAPTPIPEIGSIGMLLMGWYGLQIYLPKKKKKELITSGLFKFTRHPMYTGIFLMGIHIWWPVESTVHIGWLVSLLLFLFGLSTAAYIQERETLARFGSEAEEYYKKLLASYFAGHITGGSNAKPCSYKTDLEISLSVFLYLILLPGSDSNRQPTG